MFLPALTRVFYEMVGVRELCGVSLELERAVMLIPFCACHPGDAKLDSLSALWKKVLLPCLLCGHSFLLSLLTGCERGLWGFCLRAVQLNFDTLRQARASDILLEAGDVRWYRVDQVEGTRMKRTSHFFLL